MKTKMSRIVILFILLLILLCSAPAVNAQDVSTIAKNVKAIVKETSSCWKLFHEEQRTVGDRAEVWVNWVCGKEGVVVYLYQESSVAEAAKLLYEIRTSPVQSLAVAIGTPPIGPYQFGDESFVRSNLLYSSSSYVFFRKGNMVVRTDSGTTGKASSKRTLKNAVRFAQLFVDHMPPPNDSIKQTRNQQPLREPFHRGVVARRLIPALRASV